MTERVSAIMAALSLFAFAILAIAVSGGYTDSFDHSVRGSINSHASAALTDFFRAVSYSGKVGSLVVFGTIAVLGFVRARKYREIAGFLVIMGGEIVVEMGSKAFFARERPEPFFGLPPPGSFSFPSGHVLGTLCFCGALAFCLGRPTTDERGRRWMVLAFAIWVVLVAVSRVYLGLHYPTDVAAGFLLGIAWLSAGWILVRRILRGGAAAT